MSFTSLQLIDPLLKALETEGYSTPTPIQEKAIPVVLQQKDLLGCAQTGTGKTAAFALPILQLLTAEKRNNPSLRGIKCLILTPTRELAIQIGESFISYGRNLSIRSTVIFGGVSQHSQVMQLKSGIDVLIATPGRLLDLMNQGFIKLDTVGIFVLDEADRMLDMGFIHDVKKVLVKLPERKQTLFFSATMPVEIVGLANSILKNPTKVEVTPVSSTADTIEQSLYFVEKSDKKGLLAQLLTGHEITNALVFTRTKHGANKVVKDLVFAGFSAEAIHGNKSQNARQLALKNFKAGKTRVLVATDIAARGLDIDSLSHVINYEIPNIPETYVHRIGRTGRAGASGISISFCEADERPFLADIQKLINREIPVVTGHEFESKVPHRFYNAAKPASKPSGSNSSRPPQGAVRRNNSRGNSQQNRPTAGSVTSNRPEGSGRNSRPNSDSKSSW